MRPRDHVMFLDEVEVMMAVRGVDGFQELTGVYENGDNLCIVSLYAGQPLNAWLRDTRPTEDQRVQVALHVSGAVDRLHDLGLAHLDLHEENVCVEVKDGQVKVTIIDFGMAKFVAREDINPLALMANGRNRDANKVHDLVQLCLYYGEVDEPQDHGIDEA